jgi:biopolymer transport protein ExbD
MNLEIFQSSFRNKEINIKPYLQVVSILLSIFVIIISFNFTIEDFYKTKGTVKEEKIKLIVDINDLNKVTNNKEIIIERDIFTYEVINISDLIYNDNIYKEVTLKIPELKDLIDNDVLDIEIIINKTNIFNYLIKTLKGE